VKSEKNDSKVLVDRETQLKAVVIFNVPSTDSSTINHSNVLGKRKRSEKKENVSYSAKETENTAARTAAEIENSRPAAPIVSLLDLRMHYTQRLI
jgi:hypothetical protein